MIDSKKLSAGSPWIWATALVVPAAVLALLVAQITLIVLSERPGHDEAELMHASWLMAHGWVPWRDFFENHSPLYMWLNARLLAPDAILYGLYARLFHLAVFYLGAGLFVWAACRWLAIERAILAPFVLLALIVYLPLAWTAELGIVRPEGYAFAALFAGCLVGYGVQDSRNWIRLLLAGFFLALAIAFSVRTLCLSVVMGLVIAGRGQNWRQALAALAMIAIGGAGALLCDLATAPLPGFYRWLVDFNSHFVPPVPRQMPESGNQAIAIGFMVIAADILGALYIFRMSREKRPFPKLFSPVLLPALTVQASMAFGWLFVLSDPAWGGQGFSGIVVAAAFFLCLVIATGLRFYRNGKPEFLLTRIVLALASAVKRCASGHAYRNSFSRAYAGTRRVKDHSWGWLVIFLVAASMAVLVLRASLSGRESAMVALYSLITLYPPGLRYCVLSFGWPGWILWPTGVALVLLALQVSMPKSRVQRLRRVALAIRLEFIFLGVGSASLLAVAAQGIWQHGPDHYAQMHIWPMSAIAAAVASAMTIGAVWHTARWPIRIYALLVIAGHLALAISSPIQIVTSAVLGAVVVILLRHHFAARRLGCSIGADNQVVTWPAPSSRLLLMLPKPAQSRNTHCGATRWAQIVPAALLMALLTWGLYGFLDARVIQDDLARETLHGDIADMAAALRDLPYRPNAISDLKPLDQTANLGEWIFWSRRYCELFRGESAAARPTLHPVCMGDPSFYWYCGECLQTMKHHGIPFRPLPPYNLEADLLRAKPALIDPVFLFISLDTHGLDPMLARDYVPVRRRNDLPWLLLRRSWVVRQFGR